MATIGWREKALALGLVDEIVTGDELLFPSPRQRAPLRSLDEARKTLLQQLLSGLGAAAQRAADVVIGQARCALIRAFT